MQAFKDQNFAIIRCKDHTVFANHLMSTLLSWALGNKIWTNSMYTDSFIVYLCHLPSIIGSVKCGPLGTQTSTAHEIQTHLDPVLTIKNLEFTIMHFFRQRYYIDKLLSPGICSRLSLCTPLWMYTYIMSLHIWIRQLPNIYSIYVPRKWCFTS